MPQLLVTAPDGRQSIVRVGQTGQYYDPSRVIWDERTDGAMPDITLGKMQRSGDQLITLDDYVPDHLAVTLSKAKAAKRDELNAAYQSVLSADIDYNSKTYLATKERRELLSEILSVGSVPGGMYLIDINGDQNTMTYADIQAIGQALLARGLAANANLVTKLQSVESAVSVDAVESITW